MSSKSAMVLGACGALGRSVTSALLGRHWGVIGVDVAPSTCVRPSYTHVVLDTMSSAETQQQIMLDVAMKGVALNAVINVAGGWAGGNAADPHASQATETMIRQSIFSSIAAAHVVARHGAKNSMLLLPGSAAALAPTPSMLGYGLTKAAVHQLTQSLAADPSSLPDGACVLAILPVTLDTPENREAMPDACKDAWTPLHTAANLIVDWAEGTNRPASGSLLILKTDGGKTRVVVST